jgi:hypothetical protein
MDLKQRCPREETYLLPKLLFNAERITRFPQVGSGGIPPFDTAAEIARFQKFLFGQIRSIEEKSSQYRNRKEIARVRTWLRARSREDRQLINKLLSLPPDELISYPSIGHRINLVGDPTGVERLAESMSNDGIWTRKAARVWLWTEPQSEAAKAAISKIEES